MSQNFDVSEYLRQRFAAVDAAEERRQQQLQERQKAKRAARQQASSQKAAFRRVVQKLMEGEMSSEKLTSLPVGTVVIFDTDDFGALNSIRGILNSLAYRQPYWEDEKQDFVSYGCLQWFSFEGVKLPQGVFAVKVADEKAWAENVALLNNRLLPLINGWVTMVPQS